MADRATCSWSPNRGGKMAKGQLRGNREAKKPKQPKKISSPVADPFKVPVPRTTGLTSAQKKK
jgi:hypothetical protein